MHPFSEGFFCCGACCIENNDDDILGPSHLASRSPHRKISSSRVSTTERKNGKSLRPPTNGVLDSLDGRSPRKCMASIWEQHGENGLLTSARRNKHDISARREKVIISPRGAILEDNILNDNNPLSVPQIFLTTENSPEVFEELNRGGETPTIEVEPPKPSQDIPLTPLKLTKPKTSASASFSRQATLSPSKKSKAVFSETPRSEVIVTPPEDDPPSSNRERKTTAELSPSDLEDNNKAHPPVLVAAKSWTLSYSNGRLDTPSSTNRSRLRRTRSNFRKQEETFLQEAAKQVEPAPSQQRKKFEMLMAAIHNVPGFYDFEKFYPDMTIEKAKNKLCGQVESFLRTAENSGASVNVFDVNNSSRHPVKIKVGPELEILFIEGSGMSNAIELLRVLICFHWVRIMQFPKLHRFLTLPSIRNMSDDERRCLAVIEYVNFNDYLGRTWLLFSSPERAQDFASSVSVLHTFSRRCNGQEV